MQVVQLNIDDVTHRLTLDDALQLRDQLNDALRQFDVLIEVALDPSALVQVDEGDADMMRLLAQFDGIEH